MVAAISNPLARFLATGYYGNTATESTRLTDDQRNTIQSAVRSQFGDDCGLWLFGSRVDDARKGGDIDLYIEIEDLELLPFVLELTKEQGEMPTFIDKLNRLEKIGVIESAEKWLALREMRNALAHDYPTEPDVQAAMLNKAVAATEQLLATLDRVDTFARRYLP